MKKILAFVLVFVMLISTACSRPYDEEIDASIDESVKTDQSNDETDQSIDKAEQSNDKTDQSKDKADTEKEQPTDKTSDGDPSEDNQSEQNQKPVADNVQQQENNQSDSNEQENKTETTAPEQKPDKDNKTPIYDDSNATPASNFNYFVHEADNYVHLMEFIGNEKNVVIPNYIDGYPVKSIGGIFCNADSPIESVVIPENMEIVYYMAFFGCKNLKTVITKSKNLIIDGRAFEHCSSLTNLTLGEGVVEVGPSAFRQCTSLRNIHIPSTLNKCGTEAFGGITIESLTFTDGIKTIGSSGCFVPAYGRRTENSFKTVTIPASVKKLHTYSFGDNLQNIIFLGDAPEVEGSEEELLPENVVIKYKKGTKGWNDPKWKDYRPIEME